MIGGEQLVDQGVSRRTIRERVDDGDYVDLGGDVFAVGHEALSRRGWLFAVLLSGGDGAALSYWTAAVLWGLLDEEPDPDILDVSTRRSDRQGCRGAKVHRPDPLDDADRVRRKGLWVTSLLRTLLDLAVVADRPTLLRLVEAAVTLHDLPPSAIVAYTRQFPKRRPGTARLRDAAFTVAGPVRLRSDLEATFRQIAREFGLPEYETNVPYEDMELDVLFRDRNAALELDWYRYHGGRRNYRRDHKKARRLARRGIALLPIAGEDVEEDLAAVVADVLDFLEHHPPVANPILEPPTAPARGDFGSETSR